jgi:glycosyltransferase involved in cell wall biosynthesis
MIKSDQNMNPQISIIVPVFNEEEILEERIHFLNSYLKAHFENFEIIVSENGSRDLTREIIGSLEDKLASVRGLTDASVADYGLALIEGIRAASFNEVAILELDYFDFDFLERGYKKLSDFDLIIGSKKISPGIDQRSLKRKLFTNGYNLLLKIFFGLPLSETHGLKVLRKSVIQRLSEACITRHAVYPSELVIRACRDPEVKVCEIPLSLPLVEIRNTRIVATKRLKKTLEDLNLLRAALKKERR